MQNLLYFLEIPCAFSGKNGYRQLNINTLNHIFDDLQWLDTNLNFNDIEQISINTRNYNNSLGLSKFSNNLDRNCGSYFDNGKSCVVEVLFMEFGICTHKTLYNIGKLSIGYTYINSELDIDVDIWKNNPNEYIDTVIRGELRCSGFHSLIGKTFITEKLFSYPNMDLKNIHDFIVIYGTRICNLQNLSRK